MPRDGLTFSGYLQPPSVPPDPIARLNMMTQLVTLDEQRKALEARVAELTKPPEATP